MSLVEINIKNFALIDDITVSFEDGFNVLTGETGAGKSIIIDAVNCVLGERADSELIRTGQETAFVQGLFEKISKETRKRLEDAGVEIEDSLIIKREISKSGKNKCYVNNNLVTLNTLKSIGEFLVDVHGQHEHQTLLNPENQLGLLDAFAKTGTEKSKFTESYEKLTGLVSKRDSLMMSEQEKQRKTDLLSFQVKEIEAAELKDGEDAGLENSRSVLMNAEKIASNVNDVYGHMLGDENVSGALSNLQEALKKLQNLSLIDKGFEAYLENLGESIEKIKDVAGGVSGYREKMDFNPKRLEEIDDRLDLVKKLKKKYGGSIPEINAYFEKIKGELRSITRNEEEIESLNKEIEAVKKETARLAVALSEKRIKAAKDFEKKVVEELNDLGMAKTRFKADIKYEEGEPGHIEVKSKKYNITKDGMDLVSFLISPNVGEDLKPLEKIASGGELSRIMLALKVILGESDKVASLVFDEIDTGIGGNMGGVIGEKMDKVAKTHQVITITHLPQIAAMAGNHLNVTKKAEKGKTVVKVEVLTKETRVKEIARMLGDSNKDITHRHAKELLKK